MGGGGGYPKIPDFNREESARKEPPPSIPSISEALFLPFECVTYFDFLLYVAVFRSHLQ